VNPGTTEKKRDVVLLAFVALLVLVGLFSLRGSFPSHPRFGAIYEAAAFDLNKARHNPIGVFLRKYLPGRVVQSPQFPSRRGGSSLDRTAQRQTRGDSVSPGSGMMS
jgi:hypothetical protein